MARRDCLYKKGGGSVGQALFSSGREECADTRKKEAARTF